MRLDHWTQVAWYSPVSVGVGGGGHSGPYMAVVPKIFLVVAHISYMIAVHAQTITQDYSECLQSYAH